jgi:osmotically inducible protein OsmC
MSRAGRSWKSAVRRSKRTSASGLSADSGYGLAAELHVTLPGVEADIADEVVREAHALCPYSNATRGNVDVRLTVTPADGKIRAVV